jgi:hypothetical protein
MVQLIGESIPSEEILGIATHMEYCGFNPLKIFSELNKKMKNDPLVKKSIHIMIAFGLTRGFGGGKTWKQILEKTVPAGRDILEDARDKLEVKLGKPSSDTTVTIPRLMQVFAPITFKIHCVLYSQGVINAYGYNGNLPEKLRWIGSPSCLSSTAWSVYKKDYVEFSQYCSKVWARPQDEETASRFAELAHQTNTWPMDKRFKKSQVSNKLRKSDEEEEEEDTEGKGKESSTIHTAESSSLIPTGKSRPGEI